VDFLRRRVRVERKIVESGKLIVGEPKTKRSRRWVSIPEPIALTLSEHVRLYAKDDSLFPGPEGGPLRRKTFRRAWTGAPPNPRGSLASGSATFAIAGPPGALEAGVSPVLVAFRLGHSTTRIIEQHYGRLVESMDADIARRLGDARTAETGPMRDRSGTAEKFGRGQRV